MTFSQQGKMYNFVKLSVQSQSTFLRLKWKRKKKFKFLIVYHIMLFSSPEFILELEFQYQPKFNEDPWFHFSRTGWEDNDFRYDTSSRSFLWIALTSNYDGNIPFHYSTICSPPNGYSHIFSSTRIWKHHQSKEFDCIHKNMENLPPSHSFYNLCSVNKFCAFFFFNFTFCFLLFLVIDPFPKRKEWSFIQQVSSPPRTVVFFLFTYS